MAVTPFCAWSDVEARLSADGATLRTDDSAAAAQAYCLRRATMHVFGYAGLHYSTAALAASEWVTEITADCAWFFACTRRNNPPPKAAVEAFERATRMLEEVRDLILRIPDAPMQKGFAPVLTNQGVRQYPVSQIKNVPGTSTGTPEDYTPHPDTWNGIDYSV